MSVSLPGMGNQVRVRLTRRVVRLLVLLGVVVAAYLVLSLFDRAAHADAGSIDQSTGSVGATEPAVSVKAVAGAARKAVPEPKSIIPKSSASTARPPRIHRPTITVPEVRQRASAAVRDTARAAVTPARTAVVRQLPSLPDLVELPDLPRAGLRALPQLPSGPHPMPAPTRSTALPSVPVPHRPLMPPVSAQLGPLPQAPAFAPAPGLSGVTKPPAAPARPWTAPLPAPPGQPADRSTLPGQARDSGGGNAPAMGTVSSSWRPEVAAAGRRPTTDLLARGRTVRYAGPPS